MWIPDINKRLQVFIDHKTGGNVSKFAEQIGSTPQKINRFFSADKRSGKYPDPLKTEVVLLMEKTYPDFNKNWFLTGEGEMIHMEGKSLDTNIKITPNLKPKEYNGVTPVKVVTTKARGGWTDSYYSDEYLTDMPTVLIESDENYHGEYLAFEVDGDSMEPDYYAGDIVICRNIKRDLWKHKLHYNEYDFVIAHGTKGVMLKEIIDHDTETGTITCHSLNDDGGRNKDFKLKLGEIAYLYNVVEIRQKGKSKRCRR